MDVDGVKVGHLGDLGHVLSDGEAAALGGVDVLLAPVGGYYTIGPEEATRTWPRSLGRAVIIPMHYKTEALGFPDPAGRRLPQADGTRRANRQHVRGDRSERSLGRGQGRRSQLQVGPGGTGGGASWRSWSSSLGVIPARLGSTRFPGKVLAPSGGKPLVRARVRTSRAGVGRRRGTASRPTATRSNGLSRRVWRPDGDWSRSRADTGSDRMAVGGPRHRGRHRRQPPGRPAHDRLPPTSTDGGALASDDEVDITTLAFQANDLEGYMSPRRRQGRGRLFGQGALLLAGADTSRGGRLLR